MKPKRSNEQRPGVVLVSEQYAPDMSSTAQLFEELLVELRRQGMRTAVCSMTPGYIAEVDRAPLREIRKGVKVRRMPRLPFARTNRAGEAMNWLWGTVAMSALALMTSRRDPLLVCTNPPMAHVVGALMKILKGQRFLALHYDLHPELPCAVGMLQPGSAVDRLWRRLNRWALRHADVAIAIGGYMEQAIKARYEGARTTIIHNWCDEKIVQPLAKRDSRFAREHELVDKFVVLFSGNMGRRQRLEILLEVATDLRDVPVRFVFIGEGVKQSKLQQQAQERGLSNVLFLPYQPRELMTHSLAAADLAVVSHEREVIGFGVPCKIYAYLASGRALLGLASRPCEVSDLIEESQCGWCFDEDHDRDAIGGKIRELLNDPRQVQLAGERAVAFFRNNFTLEIIAQQYWENIAAQHQAGPAPAIWERLWHRRWQPDNHERGRREFPAPARLQPLTSAVPQNGFGNKKAPSTRRRTEMDSV